MSDHLEQQVNHQNKNRETLAESHIVIARVGKNFLKTLGEPSPDRIGGIIQERGGFIEYQETIKI